MGHTNGISKSTAAFRSIRDRFRLKPNFNPQKDVLESNRKSNKPTRSHNHRSSYRKITAFSLRGRSWSYLCFLFVIFTFALVSMVLHSSIISMILVGGRERVRWAVREDLVIGSSLRFWPRERVGFSGRGIDWLRDQPRNAIRVPRIGLHRELQCQTVNN